MAGWGAGMQIGGLAEQDLANIISTGLAWQAAEQGVRDAQGQVRQGYDRAAGYLQPLYNTGMQDYQELREGVGGGAYNYDPEQFQRAQEGAYGTYSGTLNEPTEPGQQNFQFSGQNVLADPGYQFRLQQGTAAINSGAAAQGSTLSGATLKALDQYGQGLASQEYANAYNRARGAYESDRAFNRGAYQDQRDYQLNKYLANAGLFNQNREFARNQYLGNQTLDWNAQNAYQGRMADEMGARYARQAALGNVGLQASGDLSSLNYLYGTDLANLAMARGNVRSAGYRGLGNAFMQQGEHLTEIGGMGGASDSIGSWGGGGQ